MEGSVEDHDGVATAGDYVWRKPGSAHANKSPGGAVLFAVYRKPNIYYHPAKETKGFQSYNRANATGLECIAARDFFNPN